METAVHLNVTPVPTTRHSARTPRREPCPTGSWHREKRKDVARTPLRLTIAAFVLAVFNLSAATLHVSLLSTNPVAPFATWETAATNIQDAVDAAKAGDTVLVTNGVYAVGERITGTNEGPWAWEIEKTRVVVTNAIRLETVSGPLVTVIDGGSRAITNEVGEVSYEGARCVYLGTNAVLSSFTLTNGWVGHYGSGAGVYCAADGHVTNCIVTGNGRYSAAYGGRLDQCTLTNNGEYGADNATLHNCNLSDNSGAGALNSTLHNCTLIRNHWRANSSTAGGAYRCTLYDCTLSDNLGGGEGGGGARECTLYNCTLTGNIDTIGAGASRSVLYNCRVVGNLGGAVYDSTLFNCTVIENEGGMSEGGISGTAFNSIIYYNSGGNYGEGTLLNYCLTSPLPTNGVGNITGPPLFMDLAGRDFRLREDSPCIDAGTNLLGVVAIDDWWGPVPGAYSPTDILGNSRFIDGNGDGIVAWDIGAYEFDSFQAFRFSGPPIVTVSEDPDWSLVRTVRLTITGAPNRWFHVQKSSDLRDWKDVTMGPAAVGPEGVTQVGDRRVEWVDPDSYWAGERMTFYRVVVP